MYIEDVKQISHLLKYNFLKIISDKYLSLIPFTGNILKQEHFSITLEIPSNRFIIKKKIRKTRKTRNTYWKPHKKYCKKQGNKGTIYRKSNRLLTRID